MLAHSRSVLGAWTLPEVEEVRTSCYREEAFNVAWALAHSLTHVAEHGVNLKIKWLNRRGFGYRNFDHFRLLVLTAFGP